IINFNLASKVRARKKLAVRRESDSGDCGHMIREGRHFSERVQGKDLNGAVIPAHHEEPIVTGELRCLQDRAASSRESGQLLALSGVPNFDAMGELTGRDAAMPG